MSESDDPKPAHRRLIWSLTLAVVAVQCLVVLNPEIVPLDHEELYNAGHARMLQLGHLDAFQRLQYRGYCGGCTVNALAGAAIFAALGPSLFAWKLVPILYSGLAVYFGTGALARSIGPMAAAVFAGLFILPPPMWQELSLVGWGNHYESGCLAIVALALMDKVVRTSRTADAMALGAVVGLGLWVGFSSGFVAIAAAVVLSARRRWRSLATVVLTATPVFAIWLLQAHTTSLSILETIYYSGERLPDPSRVPTKLWSLFAPRQLVALFGHGAHPVGWALGWAWAAVAAWAATRAYRSSPLLRIAGATALSFLAVYTLVRFTVWAPPSPEIAPPGSMRYAAPLIPVIFLLVAGAIGSAWQAGRRASATMALVPLITVGVGSRATAFSGSFPSTAALSTFAPDFEYFRNQASYRLSEAEHLTCDTQDYRSESVHAYGLGWHAAQTHMATLGTDTFPPLTTPQDQDDAFFQAVGAAIWTGLGSSGLSHPSDLVAAHRQLTAQPRRGQHAALTEVAWRQADVWMEVMRDGRPHNGPTLRTINEISAGLPKPADTALRFAMGRRWAHDLARWGHPATLSLPSSPVPGPGFLEGLAYGLGNRWGPDIDLNNLWPASTPPSPAVRRSFEAGASARWLTPDD